MTKRYCHASSESKLVEQSHFSMTKWESEKHKSWVHQQRASRAMMPPMALCWAPLENEEHVVGQWRSWTAMKSWDSCAECMAHWMQNLRSGAPSSGRS